MERAEQRHVELVSLAAGLFYKDGTMGLTIRYEPRKSSKFKWLRTQHALVARMEGKGNPTFRMDYPADGGSDNAAFLKAFKAAFDLAIDWATDAHTNGGRWQKVQDGGAPSGTWQKAPVGS